MDGCCTGKKVRQTLEETAHTKNIRMVEAVGLGERLRARMVQCCASPGFKLRKLSAEVAVAKTRVDKLQAQAAKSASKLSASFSPTAFIFRG